MVEGSDLVSHIITQYTVIEGLYAREGSELSASLRSKAQSALTVELRASLLSLYIAVLRYQIRAIDYFDSKQKFFQRLKSFNPISADHVKDMSIAVNEARQQVDRNAAQVHQYATIHGMDELLTGKNELKDGLVHLAEKTGSAMRNQTALLEERFREVMEEWQKPIITLADQFQEEKEIAELVKVRKWLSTAQPEEDYKQAKGRRPLSLGGWLLEHPKFERWRKSAKSSIFWTYGFAGTGKTSLALRVIESFRSELEDVLVPGHLAFFFCSNDTAGIGSGESLSRADPEEALRSVVSQLSTTQQGRSIAPLLHEK